MTYDMTTPIGPVTPNEWTEGLMETSKTYPNIQKPRDQLARNNFHADVGFCA